jgi:hypothetical protein
LKNTIQSPHHRETFSVIEKLKCLLLSSFKSFNPDITAGVVFIKFADRQQVNDFAFQADLFRFYKNTRLRVATQAQFNEITENQNPQTQSKIPEIDIIGLSIRSHLTDKRLLDQIAYLSLSLPRPVWFYRTAASLEDIPLPQEIKISEEKKVFQK